jgi:hypothetical protein
MKLLKLLAAASLLCALGSSFAYSQTWTPLVNQPPAAIGAIVQLRDGRIFAHEEQDGNPANWYFYTPDSTGSYLNGTWSGPMPLPVINGVQYAPFFFSSQVMLDGKHVIVEGGEYNQGQQVETTLGAIFDLTTNTWTANAPPTGWANIGDAESIILADGRYLQMEALTKQTAFFNGPNSWTAGPNTLSNRNNEAGWALLQNSKVLMVDAFSNPSCNGTMSTELLDPNTNTWGCGAPMPSQLFDNSGHELGPIVVGYNGKAFAVGAVPKTNVYDPVANSWAAGPNIPNGLVAYDGPGALENNGKALIMVSQTNFGPGCQMMEYSYGSNTLTNTVNPSGCPSDPSFVGHLMVLPTGQIMFTDFSNVIELYTPAPGPGANNNRPTIISNGPINHFTQSGNNNVVMGFKLNGVTQGTGYGDDYQGDTNYPLVRLTNMSTGQVYFGNTHDDSSHSIDPAFGSMTTMFDLPAGFPRGPQYKVEVIAGGLASNFLVYN